MAKPQAAVIGSGFGGISAAIRLQASGFDVHVFEKRDLPGGRAYVFKDQGFTFDAGPTVITAPDCIKELFEISGKNMSDYVELVPVQPFYRLMWEDGYRFDYTNNDSLLYKQIGEKSPQDVQGYKNFLEYSKEVFNEGYTNLVHVPFLSIWSMIKVAPQLIRLGAYRSVYYKVSKFIRDARLREAFSFHSLLVGGNPFSASSIYTLIHYLEKNWGVFFPKGGTGALVQGLVRLFQDLGGTIHLNSEIDEILTENQRVYAVRLKKNGEIFPCNLVVSNADVARTYRDLLKNEASLKSTRRHVLRMKQSMSLFLIYFGTKKKFPETAHHSVIFGPRYKELLKDIFVNGKLSDDFSLYLHSPCRTDSSLAPEGCDAFYVLSPVPNLERSEINWKTEGSKYADRILSYLDKHYMPGLKDEIITQRIFTPMDFESELNSQFGAAFSFQPTLTQSAYFRTHNRDRKVRGLYFVGAGTHPGAGVPGVINSAKATAGLVIEDHARNLIRICRDMISKGSKSFSLASHLFANEKREAAHCLYGWCRYCDDQIDMEDPATAVDRLKVLIEQTKNSYSNSVDHSNPVFAAMSLIVKKYQIPAQYPLDLLQGMQMDVEKRNYETIQDLLVYCYCVAGTVGLMMAHVMGVSEEKALKNACDLGTAMQLTNIARDIMEDAAMGRVYLPQEWLREAGLDNSRIADPQYRGKVFEVVKRLLDYADHYYYSGESGLKYLSLRSAFTIASASGIYAEIGKLVLARKDKAWDERATVSLPRKVWIVAHSFFKVVELIPERVIRPWASTLIKEIWRPI